MPDELESLWGDEFIEPSKKEKEKTKKILDKIAKPKQVKVTKVSSTSYSKGKAKELDIDTQLQMIKTEVWRILGKQAENIEVIQDYDSYVKYMDAAIKSGEIAIDTETNNSLDPVTCKIMGLCLYYPGGKQVYVPVNHVDPHTKVRLSYQLTEKQICEQLQRLVDQRPKYNSILCKNAYGQWHHDVIFPYLGGAYTRVIMHNGKFDYQVIKCTCGVELPIDWDTLIAAKLIDENEYSAGLKQQYLSKIDPEQEKYDIEGLFNLLYELVDPKDFSLYAATDSMMTYKLKEYQRPILESPDYAKIYKLFIEVEMPLVTAIAEMELNGMEIDQVYAKRLSEKFNGKLTRVDAELNELLTELKPIVSEWRLTPDALDAQKKKQSDKQRVNALKSANYDDSLWSYINGEWYKVSKSKNDQLNLDITPDTLSSPTQLGIILYSILKCPVVNDEKPTATGEDELTKIIDKSDNDLVKKLCGLILERRELVKLLTTYIDNIPELAKRWPDGRVRTHFNQYGAQTGRLSSSDPVNFQNVPSHEKSIRMLFRAHDEHNLIELSDNYYDVSNLSEVETKDGWKELKELKVGDILELDDGESILQNIIFNQDGSARLFV